MIRSIFRGEQFKVTSIYGNRVLNGNNEFHGGLDLVGISSWDVVSIVDGTVIQSRIVTDKNNLTWQWGNYVCILGIDGRYYYYCHLASRSVNSGQQVKAGDKLGMMGNTGYSFGAHTHFEVRESDGRTKVNPAPLLGIDNAVGIYQVTKKLTANDYIEMIVKKVGYSNPEPVIQSFKLLQHPYKFDLFRKLYEALK